ncbi:MAG: prepilin-type N-terminal cleavage/methylation domain-containing protein [Bacteriovoracaceae bacterium]|nr:prepilin-type N-terminal cleavage/methylation domain-containing protein [Bacteriovoracaceae bacterium]
MHLRNQNGFSLFEILVALFLVTLIFISIPSSNQTNRKNLELALDDIDRAIRFAGNEAILRNSLVRLTIDMNEAPIVYSVEAANDSKVLQLEENEKTVTSLKEDESQQKKIAQLDSQFQAVPEFEKMKRELSEFVSVIGSYTGNKDRLIQEGKLSLYFYPSGERDSALIFFSSDTELATLEILPYQNKTTVKMVAYDMNSPLGMEQQQKAIMQEMYSEWLRE